MTSPQKENGYTAIANEIMDALVKYPLPGVQMQCLLFIFRKTYGFNKKIDSISLTQFEKATNVDRRHIHRAIRELVKKRLIVTVNSVTKEGTKKTTTYRFNKRYKSWLVSPKKVRGSAKISKLVSPKKVKTKDTLTKDKLQFNVFWEMYGKKVDRKKCETKWNKLTKSNQETIIQLLPAYITNTPDIQYRKNPMTYLNNESWNDEIITNVYNLNQHQPGTRIKTDEEMNAK